MTSSSLAPADTIRQMTTGSRRFASAPLHMVGWALVAVALGMGASELVGLAAGDREPAVLFGSGAILFAGGLACLRMSRAPARVTSASAFATVSAVWIAVSVAGAVPYLLAGTFEHWDDAVFESVSGFTATGATVMSDIESNARGLLFWRQVTQWLGSMGMVVLAVAVLPLLGVGGMELLKAEAPGPDSDRLAPRVSQTARHLWRIYLWLTASAAVLMIAVGMSLYDAVAHAMTAVATGGFSPHNTSIAHFDSLPVEIVTMVAMVAGAVNFTLFWHAVRGRGIGAFWRSAEFRFYMFVLAGATAVITLVLMSTGYDGAPLRDAAFSVTSLMSTCGFGTADFVQWSAAAQLVLLFLMVTGGMAGSTSGAVKLFRVQVMLKHAWRELRRARHPNGSFPIKLGSLSVPERIVAGIMGFVMLYFVLGAFGILLLCALGADLSTSVGSIVTAMGGVGPGLGETGPASNFLPLSRPARAVMDVYMLFGRLEIFPMFLMFSPLAAAVSRSRRSHQRAGHVSSSPLVDQITTSGEG